MVRGRKNEKRKAGRREKKRGVGGREGWRKGDNERERETKRKRG